MTANQQITDVDIDQELWQHFVKAEQSFFAARTRLTQSPSAVALIRAAKLA